ncbi:SAM-dependent methyltransferase TehB [Legionella nagasakiensis]|uniref:SAM-dependent methyltransferase TehB n=1 Tax=Legionella nagasakiensis TaxID=535290 RepID=UPI0010560C1C|nr:SAM-dependent methyltransferase TehB [Legionella nagasakiensis]
MFKFPDDLICYNQTDIAHDGNLIFFLEKHSTKEGTWGFLQLTSGEIDFIFLDGSGQELSRQRLNQMNSSQLIPPASWHKIQPISEVFTASLEFYCKPHRFFSKKHRLAAVHSDLLYIYQTYVQKQDKLDILDVGCGSGRNLLFLGLAGHHVTGIDVNESSLQQIDHIAQQEKMTNVVTKMHDLHHSLNVAVNAFDFVISTVSLQFLQPERIPSLLTELQLATRVQGLHLLIFPIAAKTFAWPASFTYLAASNELYEFYQNRGWSILEYKETVGHLHKLDESGKPMQGLFGLLLAQKIA